jgi:hypothetical protein
MEPVVRRLVLAGSQVEFQVSVHAVRVAAVSASASARRTPGRA